MHAQGGKGELANDTSEAEPEKPILPSIEPVRKRDRLASKETLPDGPRPDYLSYLVRLWRVGHGGEEHWRASLQRPGTEEPIWFADVEEMLAFLRSEIADLKRE